MRRTTYIKIDNNKICREHFEGLESWDKDGNISLITTFEMNVGNYYLKCDGGGYTLYRVTDKWKFYVNRLRNITCNKYGFEEIAPRINLKTIGALES